MSAAAQIWRAGDFQLRRLRERLVAGLPGTISHGLFLGGLAAIAVGSGMAWRPLGPIVGGILAVWASFRIDEAREK